MLEQLTQKHSLSVERVEFLKKVYSGVFAGIVYFIIVQAILLHSQLGAEVFKFFYGLGKWTALGLIILYLIISSAAQSISESDVSFKAQVIAFFVYDTITAIIMFPLIAVTYIYMPQLLMQATVYSLLMFGCLTYIAFTTKTDFSFLESALRLGFFAAVGFIICSIIFGFSLGTLFLSFVILLLCGDILYETQQIIYKFDDTKYVGAALRLFSSLIIMFWYILRLLYELKEG